VKDSRSIVAFLALLWLWPWLVLASEQPAADTRVLSLRQLGAAGSAGDNPRIEAEARLIQQVQIELARRGYQPGEPDGYLGKATREAVQAFQRDAGLELTGQVDSELLARLERRAFVGRPFFSMAAGGSPSLIGNAQLALSRAGYYRGPVDGILTPVTRAAIRDYRTVPYEQFFIDGYPRDYPYLSPAAQTQLPSEPSFALAADWPGSAAYLSGDMNQTLAITSVVVRALESEPAARSRAFFVRGLAHLHLADYEAAVRDFTSVLRREPDNADAYLNRAIGHERAGLTELARRDYRRAIDLGLEALPAAALAGLP
jgi:tetratricopeptide (TPR) repeat protein